MKRYKVKDVDVDVLRKSEGKICTEELFLRDLKLCKMFARYMLSNVNYLKKYEYDSTMYDHIGQELEQMLKNLDWIGDCFKKHQEEDQS